MHWISAPVILARSWLSGWVRHRHERLDAAAGSVALINEATTWLELEQDAGLLFEAWFQPFGGIAPTGHLSDTSAGQ